MKKLNSVNRPRTLQQIKSKYDNLKTAARKYASKCRENYIKTGGGNSDYKENVIYEKMLDIINKKTVFGLQNPFDDDAECSVSFIQTESTSPTTCLTTENTNDMGIVVSEQPILIYVPEEENNVLANSVVADKAAENGRNVEGNCLL